VEFGEESGVAFLRRPLKRVQGEVRAPHVENPNLFSNHSFKRTCGPYPSFQLHNDDVMIISCVNDIFVYQDLMYCVGY